MVYGRVGSVKGCSVAVATDYFHRTLDGTCSTHAVLVMDLDDVRLGSLSSLVLPVVQLSDSDEEQAVRDEVGQADDEHEAGSRFRDHHELREGGHVGVGNGECRQGDPGGDDDASCQQQVLGEELLRHVPDQQGRDDHRVEQPVGCDDAIGGVNQDFNQYVH